MVTMAEMAVLELMKEENMCKWEDEDLFLFLIAKEMEKKSECRWHVAG